MAINNIIIVGCNIIGLYSALRCVDNGYRVSIIERLSQDKLNSKNRNNYRVFNKSHQLYLHLLNRFSIQYETYILKYNEKTTNVLTGILNKSKLIPKKSLNTQSFVKFCRSILSITDYNILKNNLEAFEHIYSNISAMDALVMLSCDISTQQDYYILTDDFSLLIERITAYFGAQSTSAKFISVRFGNVLGSRGSVLMSFRDQIEKGGPVTVTHRGVTRYFMTISEAVQLVIQAGAIGSSGEVLVLDMGSPVSIYDVAARLVRNSQKNVEIEIVGLRAGEKVHEELFGNGEVDTRPKHPLISHVLVSPIKTEILLAEPKDPKTFMIEVSSS